MTIKQVLNSQEEAPDYRVTRPVFKVPEGVSAWLEQQIPRLDSTNPEGRYAYVCGFRACVDLLKIREEKDNR